MMKSPPLYFSVAVGEALSDLARKAEICAKVLVEARKLSRGGQVGTLGNQLVVRASELLDDMDEILAALDPVKNRPSFAVAASLHHELASIRRTLANPRRRSAPSPYPAGKR